MSHAVQLEADLTQVVERLRQDINLEAYGEKNNLKLSHRYEDFDDLLISS